jgi:hypothetical protein
LTLQSWEFGDPPDVVERRRGSTCHGCKKLGRDETPGYEKWFCRIARVKSAKRVEEMARCVKFSLDK